MNNPAVKHYLISQQIGGSSKELRLETVHVALGNADDRGVKEIVPRFGLDGLGRRKKGVP